MKSKYSKEFTENFDKIFRKKCYNCGNPASVKVFDEYFCVECADLFTDGCTNEIINELKETENE